MLLPRFAVAVGSLFVFISAIAQNENPLLVHSNAPIQFSKINAAIIKEAVDKTIAQSNERLKKIIAIIPPKRSTDNTLVALDGLIYYVTDLGMKLGVIAATSTDEAARNAANDEGEKLSNYSSSLFLNEGLFKALRIYSGTAEAKYLAPNRKKYLKETILWFEKNGMKLDAKGRKHLEVLNEKLASFGTQFEKNIGESKDSLEFSEEELKGVAEATKQPWKRANGKYMVTINGPNYNEVMNNADNSNTRRTMLVHYNNRAYPKNMAVLDSLFFYRNEYAKKLGFKSYAAYSVVDKMAASPQNVWNFENDLVSKLSPYVTKEINELKALKKSLHPKEDNMLNEWDISYYKKKLLDTKYNLSTDEVKEYFEMNNTLKGMFTVYQKLFSIEIKEIQNQLVWYSKVKSFEMYKEGKKIGNFYLDLFPRPDKYTHFACFPISQYRIADGKETLPVSALICNFPEGTAEQPSLLYHTDVVTLFHEFGHLVHSMLGRSDMAMQGPFSVKGDFTEAPSQFLENWVWEYEPLSMFAKHYKTGAPLPKSLFDKMKQTQQVGVAMQYIRQTYFGMLDFTYEDKYDSIRGTDLTQVSKDLSAMRQIPFVDGSHFICSFGHLNGYAANYYGYLWSKVFAEDMFSLFKINGVMDVKTGLSYRNNILEKASTIEEKDMLKNFLGREPNSDAFLNSLGIRN